MSQTDPHRIVPREKLDFGLDGDIPQYWFAGDVFKTRFFDALSTIFPEGERFFIECVRDFRHEVKNPVLAQEVKDFIRQEGQHGIIHGQYNQRLKAQGIDVDKLEAVQAKLFAAVRQVQKADPGRDRRRRAHHGHHGLHPF